MMRDASRRVVAPRGIDVPARLPGGVWGPPNGAFGIGVKYNANGVPEIFCGGEQAPGAQGLVVPDHVAAQAEIRAEQPWPQVWAARCGITALKEAPVAINPPVVVEFGLDTAVESSSFTWPVPVGWFGDELQMFPSAATPLELVGQSLRIRPRRIRPIQANVLLANFDTVVTYTWLIGLISPPQRVTP